MPLHFRKIYYRWFKIEKYVMMERVLIKSGAI